MKVKAKIGDWALDKYCVLGEWNTLDLAKELNDLYEKGYVLHTAYPCSNSNGFSHHVVIMELKNPLKNKRAQDTPYSEAQDSLSEAK